MTKLIAWATRNIVFILIVAVGIAIVFTVNSCQRERTAKTRENVATGQTKAAVESGRDAVETIGNRQAADDLGRDTVRETKDEIRNASDVPGVSGAGRNGLCRLAGNRGKPECVQHAPAR